MQRALGALGLADAVIFEGFVDEHRKRALYAAAWVFAITSEMEGWGLTVVEAGASGTPSVGFRVPGVREIVLDHVSGILVDTVAQFIEATIRVLNDPTQRAILGIGALRRSREFSWDATTQSFIDAIVGEIAHSHTNYIQTGEEWTVVPHKLMRSTTSLMRREFDLTDSSR